MDVFPTVESITGELNTLGDNELLSAYLANLFDSISQTKYKVSYGTLFERQQRTNFVWNFGESPFSLQAEQKSIADFLDGKNHRKGKCEYCELLHSLKTCCLKFNYDEKVIDDIDELILKKSKTINCKSCLDKIIRIVAMNPKNLGFDNCIPVKHGCLDYSATAESEFNKTMHDYMKNHIESNGYYYVYGGSSLKAWKLDNGKKFVFKELGDFDVLLLFEKESSYYIYYIENKVKQSISPKDIETMILRYLYLNEIFRDFGTTIKFILFQPYAGSDTSKFILDSIGNPHDKHAVDKFLKSNMIQICGYSMTLESILDKLREDTPEMLFSFHLKPLIDMIVN